MNVSVRLGGPWGEGEKLLPPSPGSEDHHERVGDGEEGARYQMLHRCSQEKKAEKGLAGQRVIIDLEALPGALPSLPHPQKGHKSAHTPSPMSRAS